MRAVGKKVGKMKVGGMTFDAVGGVLYASLSGGRLDAWKVDRGAWVGWEGEGGGKFLKGRWTVGKGKGWKEVSGEGAGGATEPSYKFGVGRSWYMISEV